MAIPKEKAEGPTVQQPLSKRQYVRQNLGEDDPPPRPIMSDLWDVLRRGIPSVGRRPRSPSPPPVVPRPSRPTAPAAPPINIEQKLADAHRASEIYEQGLREYMQAFGRRGSMDVSPPELPETKEADFLTPDRKPVVAPIDDMPPLEIDHEQWLREIEQRNKEFNRRLPEGGEPVTLKPYRRNRKPSWTKPDEWRVHNASKVRAEYRARDNERMKDEHDAVHYPGRIAKRQATRKEALKRNKEFWRGRRQMSRYARRGVAGAAYGAGAVTTGTLAGKLISEAVRQPNPPPYPPPYIPMDIDGPPKLEPSTPSPPFVPMDTRSPKYRRPSVPDIPMLDLDRVLEYILLERRPPYLRKLQKKRVRFQLPRMKYKQKRMLRRYNRTVYQ